MPTHQVNLDSLILRQPFPPNDTFSGKNPLFKLEELGRTKMYFNALRKPDFQRDTSNWNPRIICEFIRTFLDGGLIPSIIVWHSKNTNNVYVIDGAHRLSALIAYVNDDYGAGEISLKAWGQSIPPAQAKLHKDTKTLVDNTLGSFSQLSAFALDPELTNDLEKRRRGKAISTMSMHIQTVDGDTALAEESFYRINSSAVEIDETELDVIRARNKPNALATRALISAGKGHKYWDQLPNALEIEKKAAVVHKLLFGDLSEIGPQSPDIPRAGQPYSSEAFKMVLDLVNIFNSVTPAMWSRKQQNAKKKNQSTIVPLKDDLNGTATLGFLDQIERVASLAVGAADCPESLGLEQGVYAYGNTGKFIPAAYIASIQFAQELKDKKQLIAFTLVRARFEDFFFKNKSFLNALTHSKGSRTRSVESILVMYRTVLAEMRKGGTDEDILNRITQEPQLKDLKRPVQEEEDAAPPRKRFSATVVRAKLIEEIVKARSRCTVCGACLPPSSRSKDHKKKIEEGGLGELDNLNFTHPFCNSAKDAIEQARLAPASPDDHA